jgi:GntR family transcriptional repressor for pyruvate dehydrogenase complex
MGRHRDDVLRELVDAIVAGEYAEGDWMPSETVLGERFGVGRTVLRQVLLGLELRGLIVVQPGRGQIVCQREEWDTRDPQVLLACIARGPEPDVLAQAIDARAVIERGAARHVCEFAHDADIELVATRLAAMTRAVEPETTRTFDGGDPLVIAETHFHRTLAQLSENPVLAKLVEPLHHPLAEVRRTRAPERDGATLLHHRRILEGLSAREPELAEDAVDQYARQLARWLGSGR